jgi:hypothetical protein
VALRLETEAVDVVLDESTHDVVIVNGDFTFTRGKPAYRQECKIALRMVRGERALNLNDGLPLIERDGVPAEEALLAQPFDEEKWRAAIREALFSVDGTVDVVRVDVALDRETRKVRVAATARGAFGDVTIEELL